MKRFATLFSLCFLTIGVFAQDMPSDEPVYYAFADPDADDAAILALENSVPGRFAADERPEALPLAPALTRAQWKTFSENLERALASGHNGLQTSALRLIIYYGDQLDLGEEAAFDVMRIYRNHEQDRVRRMAVVTLSQMNNDWAMKFLERAVNFEQSETVRQTMRAVLNEYHEAR